VRVAITGHRGFIGKNISIFLKEKEYEIQEPSANVLNTGCIDDWINQCDAVVHAAGVNKGTENNILDVNIVGTYNIAKACYVNKKKLIVLNSTYKTPSAYKVSKEIAASILHNFNDYLNTSFVNIVMPNVIGPHCLPFYNSFVTTLVWSIARGKEYESLITNESKILTLVHVDDVSDAIEKHLKIDYIGGNSYLDDKTINITIKEIIEILTTDCKHKYSEIFLNLLEWYKSNVCSPY